MLLTTGQAAQALGMSIPTVKKLLAAGTIPGAATGGRQVFPLTAAQALAGRSPAPLAQLPGPEIAVLRVDAAPSWDLPQQPTGFSAHLDPEQLLQALHGWWRCDPARVAAGGILPVTLAGFVVAVLTNLHTWEGDGGRYARYCFTHATLAGYVSDLAEPMNRTTLAPQDSTAAHFVELLLGARLPSHSGGPIAYVPTGTAATPAPAEDRD